MEDSKLIKLNQWILDPVENHLINEEQISIPLEGKYVLLLTFLAKNLNSVVSREQLMQAVWKNRCVEYRTINAAISRLRKILGGKRDDFIKTHLKRGYSLTCTVTYLDRPSAITVNIAPPGKIINEKVSPPLQQQTIQDVNTTPEKQLPELKEQCQGGEVTDSTGKTTAEQLKQKPSDVLAVESSEKPARKIISSHPFYKLYSLLATLILLITLGLFIKPQQALSPVLTKTDVNIEPLTYKKGSEILPVISKDKSLLAFIHQANHNSHYNVVIQDMETKQTVTLEAENKTFAPYWSPQGNQLFYMSLDNRNCTIKKVTVEEALVLSTAEVITSCNAELSPFYNLTIAVSPDLNWLYYTAIKTDSSLKLIKRYHLKNHTMEIISSPQGNYEGDEGLRLSPDGSMLAFKRYFDDHLESIMLIDLKNGEIKSLVTNSALENSISWGPNGSHIFYINKNEKLLKAINITTKTITPLYQYTQAIRHPLMYSDTEILLSLGNIYKVDIQRIDLTQQQAPSTLLASSFNDNSGAIFTLENGERLAFASHRSGNEQIWLKENNQFKQLTFFPEKTQIIDLSFSDNGENILFMKNDELFIVNIHTKAITAISPPAKQVNNFSWMCHSNSNILTTIRKHGSWQLYQVNTQTQESTLLSTGMTSIHGQCNKKTKTAKYYATSSGSRGVFRLTNDWKIDKNFHYFPGINLGYNLEWGVSNDAIYRITTNNEVFKTDLNSGHSSKINIGDINAWFMTVHENNLLLNNMQTADTHIAKITIADIQDRLN